MTIRSIPVNSLQRHIAPLHDSLVRGAAEVISSGYYVLGPCVSGFEQAFAEYCGTSDCVGVANGTDALELALKALEVGPGSRVALVANAAMYATSAVLACGATPAFVDVDPASATMCPDSLAAVLGSGSHRVHAVVVTHLYGRLADMGAIMAACTRYAVPVIEDCAQAHGASRSGRKAGAFGSLASFSFYPTKNLGALGDGGAVVTSDPRLAGRVRQLRQYGWSSKYTNELPGGRNSRLDEIQARMLMLMLPLLDGWNDRRRAIANRYSNEIRNPSIRCPAAAGEDYVGHLYVVHSDNRGELRAHLEALGIQTEIHYPLPDHRQPSHLEQYASVFLPVTEALAETALTLPCFPELTDSEVDQVIQACNRF